LETSSELDHYLQTQAVEGRLDAVENPFTLAREKALAKLSDFRLPRSGAWSIKLIQAAVASADVRSIKVELTKREARFHFYAQQSWTLQDIESAFFDPEPGPRRDLNHLVSALRAVGLGEKRAFLITPAGDQESLFWDGQTMTRLAAKSQTDGCVLSIAHNPSAEGPVDWIRDMASRGGRSATVIHSLTQHCYLCPVPLEVDGRRIDSLQLCPGHGRSSRTYPVKLFLSEGNLPSFGLPLGTFEELSLERKGDARMTVMSASLTKEMEQRSRACLAVLASAHMRPEDRGGGAHKGRWLPTSGDSRIYWVMDGALIDSGSLNLQPSHCTVGIYLSAEGLPTDLSGLKLTHGEPYQDRLLQALTLAHTTLKQHEFGGPGGPVKPMDVLDHLESSRTPIGTIFNLMKVAWKWYHDKTIESPVQKRVDDGLSQTIESLGQCVAGAHR
jgi:hypothetical protein